MPDSVIPLWENIVYIEAETTDQAFERAESLGAATQDLSENFTCNNLPAHLVFVGVRKLIVITESIKHGTEISYLQLEIDNEDSLMKMMKRKRLTVKFDDDEDDDVS